MVDDRCCLVRGTGNSGSLGEEKIGVDSETPSLKEGENARSNIIGQSLLEKMDDLLVAGSDSEPNALM